MKKFFLALLAVMMFGMPVITSAETNSQDEVTQVPNRKYRKSKYRRARRPLPPPPARRKVGVRPQEYRKGQPLPQHGVYGAPVNRGSCVDKVSKKRRR